MYIILLRLSEKRAEAAKHLAGHKDWIARGIADGVFLVVGGLEPKRGGALIAHGESRAEIEARVAADPFVAEGVVTAEILDVTPQRADQRLDFLLKSAD